jgi:integrase/recombinase XerD
MNELACHVEDYLSLRRALGFKLAREGQVLPQLVAYLDDAGAATLTAELAIAWAQLPVGVHPVTWTQRLGAARGFATYLKTIDPATEIPARDVFAGQGKRPAPYLWSNHDIVRLLDAARQLQPPLKAATYQTLFGLLAVSGMRISEALGLDRNDVDLAGGVITVAEGKFRRQRLIPLHPSTTDALRTYAADRDRMKPHPASTTAFFISWRGGTALGYSGVRNVFRQLTTEIGLRTRTVRPRIHDLRHSFAVRTLTEWHRAGVDLAGRMAVLSDYLGHVNPAGTYWYLSASPELMELAAARLDGQFGGRR